MKESDIIYQQGKYWVCLSSDKQHFQVMKDGVTCSESIATFNKSEYDLSIAIKYCDYKGGGRLTSPQTLFLSQKIFVRDNLKGK